MGEHKFIAKLSSPEDKLLLHKSVLWPLPCHPFFLPRKSEDDQIYNQPDTKKKVEFELNMEAFVSIWTGIKGRLKLIVREMAIPIIP